jgi:xanthine dehydrogenase YagS FAD-binding subunit
LAGGTDLVPLLKEMLITPRRVVNLMDVAGLRGIHSDSLEVTIGAATPLDEILDSPLVEPFGAVKQAIRGINSMQFQCQGTIGGEICQRPRCWFFRMGYGLLAQDGRLTAEGDNRYHAIFGNSGPAKFVSASRIAPALIALNAKLRIVQKGRSGDVADTLIPAADLFRIPRSEREVENTLAPDQFVAHIVLPKAGLMNATYEVRQSEGPDYPLAAAAAAVDLVGGVVRSARIVLGHAAPMPWLSAEAANALIGRTIDEQSAGDAGDAAVARATPLSQNEYKVHLARTAVKRAVLLAAGLETGGF